MKCPKCPESIHEMRIEGVDLDFCSGCKGIWFDKDEMAFMVELSKDFPNIKDVQGSAKATDFACPRDNKKLEELNFVSSDKLKLDRCPDCQGVWLDKAELPEVEKLASRIESPQSKIMRACKQFKEKGYQVLGVRYQ